MTPPTGTGPTGIFVGCCWIPIIQSGVILGIVAVRESVALPSEKKGIESPSNDRNDQQRVCLHDL